MREFMSQPLHQKAYQPLADILIRFPAFDTVTDYRRDLNLDTAVTSVSYRVGDTAFIRQAFVSHPAQAIVWKMSADKPGQVNFAVGLASPHRGAITKPRGSDTLVLTGRVAHGAIEFDARLQVTVQGGTLTCDGGELQVASADSAVLTLVAATNFQNYHDTSADPTQRCAAAEQALAGQSFSDLLQASVADYQQLFRRVSLDLGSTPAAQLPTDQRLKKIADNSDPQLETLYFQFGRYLLISSSRPETQPANLQGIWNDQLQPPWDSKWTVNINTEMNYWPAEVCNLAECQEPLYDLIEDCAETGRKTARGITIAEGGCYTTTLICGVVLHRSTIPIMVSGYRAEPGFASTCGIITCSRKIASS